MRALVVSTSACLLPPAAVCPRRPCLAASSPLSDGRSRQARLRLHARRTRVRVAAAQSGRGGAPVQGQYTAKVKAEIEVLRVMLRQDGEKPQRAARVLSVLDAERVSMMLQEAAKWEIDWDAGRIAPLVQEQPPAHAARILEAMVPGFALTLLNLMNRTALVAILDEMQPTTAATFLMRMAPDVLVDVVPRTTRREKVFTRVEDLEEYQEVVKLQAEMRASAEELSWLLLYAEQFTGGRLGLLNGEGGTWEPYKPGGWKGWLTLTLPVALTLVFFLVFIVEPFSEAGKEATKLLASSTF